MDIFNINFPKKGDEKTDFTTYLRKIKENILVISNTKKEETGKNALSIFGSAFGRAAEEFNFLQYGKTEKSKKDKKNIKIEQ